MLHAGCKGFPCSVEILDERVHWGADGKNSENTSCFILFLLKMQIHTRRRKQ